MCSSSSPLSPPLPESLQLAGPHLLNKMNLRQGNYIIMIRSRLNALSVTFDFFGESDWGSDWTKMDNVTLYYSIIILCNLGAKPNFLIWDDKE